MQVNILTFAHLFDSYSVSYSQYTGISLGVAGKNPIYSGVLRRDSKASPQRSTFSRAEQCMAEENLSMEQISDEAQRRKKIRKTLMYLSRRQQQAPGIITDGLILKIFTHLARTCSPNTTAPFWGTTVIHFLTHFFIYPPSSILPEPPWSHQTMQIPHGSARLGMPTQGCSPLLLSSAFTGAKRAPCEAKRQQCQQSAPAGHGSSSQLILLPCQAHSDCSARTAKGKTLRA